MQKKIPAASCHVSLFLLESHSATCSCVCVLFKIIFAMVKISACPRLLLREDTLLTMADTHTIPVVLPQTIDEVSVQLIFSTGTPQSSRRDLNTQIYVAALPPFVLGVPSQQVQLYLSEIHLGLPDIIWEETRVFANRLNHQGCRVLPEHYHEYFTSVYSRAALGREGLAPCSLRFISGHGYGTSNIRDTHVRCGKRGEMLQFAELGGSATVLTILDICSNPHVVACLADRIPSSGEELRRWDKKEVFEGLPFALACSKSTLSWCCRVGWDGQHACSSDHPDYKPDELDPKFTELLCFPVANCILAAIKTRFCEGDSHSLDQLFRDKFLQFKTRYLKKDRDLPPPPAYSDLTHLQTLIDDGVLRINKESFDCILYQREREWFPTRELAVVLDVDHANGKIAGRKIVNFVIETITAWYRKNPQERYWEKVFEDSCSHREEHTAWRTLLHMMGELRFHLLDSYFFMSNTTIDPCDIDEGASNVGLKDLALYFPHFVDLVETVQNWIEMGNSEPSFDSRHVVDDDCVPGIVEAPSSGSFDSL